jgi:hypothetical protein
MSRTCFMNNMHDGRQFTDYRPRCAVYSQSTKSDSYATRQEMIKNASKIMKENEMRAMSQFGCEPCFDTKEAGTMLPEKNMMECNKRTCVMKQNVNPKGLGHGRA